MPVSTASLRLKAEALRVLRSMSHRDSGTVRSTALPSFGSDRPIRAKMPHVCKHGTCLALSVRQATLWVLVRNADQQEAWAPVARILSPEGARAWAREGFG